MTTLIPAISAIGDASKARVVMYANGQLVQAPLTAAAVVPVVGFALNSGGDNGTGNPLIPPYQVTPIQTKLALSGVYNDSASGNIFQVSSWARNSGTSPVVAGFFQGEATGAGSLAWGINCTAFANNATAVVNGIEVDFASLVTGGYSTGILAVYDSVGVNSAGAYFQMQANHSGVPLNGIVIAKNGTNVPLQTTGSLFKTSGAFTVATGIDISSVTTTTAFKSNGFSVDGSGNVNGAAGFMPVLVGGTSASSTLTLRSTTGVGTTDAIIFQVGNAGATEAARFTTSGQYLQGYATAVATFNGLVTPAFQVHGLNGNSAAFGGYNWGNVAGGYNQLYSKSRGGAAGTRGIVSSGDSIAALISTADDGTNFVPAAEIRSVVDGTPGANSMPGRLQFSTTTSGASAVTERLRIDSNGFANVLGGSFGRAAPVTKTASFTLANTENWIICNGTATITVTLPSAATYSGREVTIKTIAAFTVVSASSNVVPLAGGAAATGILAATAGKWATLVSDGTSWQIMAAN